MDNSYSVVASNQERREKMVTLAGRREAILEYGDEERLISVHGFMLMFSR